MSMIVRTYTKTFALFDAWAESTPLENDAPGGGPRIGDPCAGPGCDDHLRRDEVYYYVTQLERDAQGREQPVCWRHVRPDKGPIRCR